MAKKKPEQMTFDELVDLVDWYESRLKYCRFLLNEQINTSVPKGE